MEHRAVEPGRGKEKPDLRRTDIAHALGLAVAAGGMLVLSNHNYPLFHTLAEMFSIVIAVGIFFVAWHTRSVVSNGFLLFLGILYLPIGLIDFVHTMAYPGMNVLSGAGTNPSAQLWLGARFMEAGAFVIAPFFLVRRVRAGASLVGILLVTAILLSSILWWGVFPAAFVEGVGLTWFKRISEFVIVGLLILAMVLTARKKAELDGRVYGLVIVSLSLMVLSELSFSLYTSPFGIMNAVGHVLKAASFYLVYHAVLVADLENPLQTLFRRLERERHSLAEAHASLERRVEKRTGRLKETTDRLREELAERQAGEERFRLMAESIDDFFWMSDPEAGGMLYTGHAFHTIWGRPPAELRERPDLLFGAVHPDDQKRYLETFAGPYTEPRANEYRIVRPDGSERWVRDRRFPVLLENGALRFIVGVAADITKEKHLQLQVETAKAALEWRVKERTAQLDEAVRKVESVARFPDENPHPVMRVSLDGKLMYANEASQVFLRLWGIGTNEAVPLMWHDAISEAAETARMRTIEGRSEGRTYLFDVVPVSGKGYVNLYGRDVTELRRTARALQRSEERYRLAQSAAGIGSWDWDLESNTVVYSPEGLRLLRISESEAKQDHVALLERIHPDDRRMVTEAVEESRRDGGDYRVEYRVLFPDGAYRWFLNMGSVIRSGASGGTRMAGIIYDITERKLFEQNLLSERESMAQRVQQQKSELSSTRESLRVKEDQHQLVQSALSSRERALEAVYTISTTLGASTDEILNQVVSSLAKLLKAQFAGAVLIDGDRFVSKSQCVEGNLTEGNVHCGACALCAAVVQSMQPQQYAKGSSELFDTGCLHARKHQSFLGTPVVNSGGTALGVLVAMDTEARIYDEHEVHVAEIFAHYIAHEMVRERMAGEIRKSQRMQVLGQLASGVAHEVRNPLNSIGAVTESLYKRLGDNPSYAPHREHLTRQVQRLAALMEDLLALGRPVEIKKEPVSIESLLRSALRDWAGSMSERAEDVRVTLPDEAGEWLVRADRLKLQGVFINLLQNAANHSPASSPIAVTAHADGHLHARVRICDSGSGIPAENVSHVFEPFYSTRKGGTGLGLSIVRHVVESHGGSVTIGNNDSGVGVTAEVVLPLSSDVHQAVSTGHRPCRTQ